MYLAYDAHIENFNIVCAALPVFATLDQLPCLLTVSRERGVVKCQAGGPPGGSRERGRGAVVGSLHVGMQMRGLAAPRRRVTLSTHVGRPVGRADLSIGGPFACLPGRPATARWARVRSCSEQPDLPNQKLRAYSPVALEACYDEHAATTWPVERVARIGRQKNCCCSYRLSNACCISTRKIR